MEDKQCIRILFLIVVLLVNFVYYQIYSYNPNQRLLKNKDITISDSDCNNDFKYGCCMIFDSCHVYNNTLRSTNLYLNPEYSVCENEGCTNCPRIRDILYDYNLYMEENYYHDTETHCGNGKFYGDYSPEKNRINNCYSLNFACDFRYYYDVARFNTSSSGTYYLQQMNVLELNRYVYPLENGKPPQISDIWMKYNKGLFKKEDRLILFILRSLVSTSLLFLLYICISRHISSKNEKEGYSRHGQDIIEP